MAETGVGCLPIHFPLGGLEDEAVGLDPVMEAEFGGGFEGQGMRGVVEVKCHGFGVTGQVAGRGGPSDDAVDGAASLDAGPVFAGYDRVAGGEELGAEVWGVAAAEFVAVGAAGVVIFVEAEAEGELASSQPITPWGDQRVVDAVKLAVEVFAEVVGAGVGGEALGVEAWHDGDGLVAQVAGVGFKPFEQGPCGGRFIAVHAGTEVETAGRVPGGGRLDGYHGPSVEGGQRAVVPAGLAYGGLPPAQERPGIMGPMRREEGEPCRVHEG